MLSPFLFATVIPSSCLFSANKALGCMIKSPSYNSFGVRDHSPRLQATKHWGTWVIKVRDYKLRSFGYVIRVQDYKLQSLSACSESTLRAVGGHSIAEKRPSHENPKQNKKTNPDWKHERERERETHTHTHTHTRRERQTQKNPQCPQQGICKQDRQETCKSGKT
jgi:hypothetical protein